MLHFFPLIDATLNAASAVLLICGFYYIRRRNIPGAPGLHACRLCHIYCLSYLLLDLPLLPRCNAFSRARPRSDFLSDITRIAHNPGGSNCPPGSDHALSSVAPALRPAPPHRRLDTAFVDLCFRHRGGCVLDALPSVSILNPFQPCASLNTHVTLFVTWR